MTYPADRRTKKRKREREKERTKQMCPNPLLPLLLSPGVLVFLPQPFALFLLSARLHPPPHLRCTEKVQDRPAIPLVREKVPDLEMVLLLSRFLA
jgi:hypothetical protein